MDKEIEIIIETTEEIIIGLQISCLCLLEMTEQGSDDQLAKSENTR